MSNTYQRLRDKEEQLDWEEEKQIEQPQEEESFVRYDKFIVLKRTDVQEALTPIERALLNMLQTKIVDFRTRICKRNKNYVVVADDWPEYETVWELIEKRIDD